MVFALVAVLVAFGALAVAGSALTKSDNAESIASVGGAGTKVSAPDVTAGS